MKKKSLTLVSILFCAITFAQSVPQGINYQAVARDVAGDVLINHALTVRFSILEGTAISWKETHQDTTNSYGLFTAIIGKGANTGGSSATFDDVDWGAASHSLKVEIDYGNGFIDMGTTDFMSVPYSLYAKKAENADSTDELQSLYISGDTLFISDGNFVILNIECFIAGCADTTACNYDPSVCYNDGSCLTAYGCTNPFAANYDPFATCDNDSCSLCWNANSPQIQLIGITSSYNTATIYGSGDTVAGIAIDSLQSNLPFDNLPVIGGSVNYGFDLTGTIDSSSVQFQVPPAPYQNINFSYVTDSSTYSYWQLDLDSQDLIIFPGYKYEVSDYFMILNTPGCVESLSDTAYSNSSFISSPVNPPSRSQVSTATAYRSMLGGGGQDSFFINSDLHMQSGTPAIIANAYPKNQYSLKDNIIFFDTTSQYEFYNNSLEYKLINRSTISGDIDLGTDLIGNDLCRFRLSTTASNPVTLTSDYRIGFTGNDSAINPANNFFELSISESKDATKFTGGTSAEAYRLRGWYLGVDVSDVKIKNINLANYPDISNNNYNEWEITLSQDFAGDTLSNILTYPLRIGKVPANPISINYFNTVQQTPVLIPDFFGISRPTMQAITWPVTALLSDLDPNWRPENNMLMSGNLFYASSPGAASGNPIGTNYGQPWPITHPASENINQNVNLLTYQLTQGYMNYSRDRDFIPQFYITGTYANNVTLLPSETTVTPLDISFNNLALWWDYTYFYGDLIMNPGVGEYPTNYNTNPGGYGQIYDHNNPIGDQQLMWCKTGYTSGNYTPYSENPYIDYTQDYYGQTQDYSSKNMSGITKNLSYTVLNDDYYQGGNKTITGTYKWLMIKDIRQDSISFGRIEIIGLNGQPLSLGDDFLLYFQEINSFFDPNFATIPYGYTGGRSGWKAVHGTWNQGKTFQQNNANEAGAYRRYTNSGAVANNFIKFYSPNANTPIFYRIGIKNGSNIKISNISITYGTN